MTQLQLIFNRTLETKKEIKELNLIIRDTYLNDEHFKHLQEEQRKALARRKEWELGIKETLKSEIERLDILKSDLENDKMLLADKALSMVMKGESINIEDQRGNKFEPIFSVRFKK